MIATFGPVSESALRKARVALLTASVACDDSIEPDLSSTSITLIPHFSGRLGFGAGSWT
jgi:hypothetical protein